MIELFTVTIIVIFLICIMVNAWTMTAKRGRDSKRLVDVAQIQKALDTYVYEKNEFPEENSIGGKWEIGIKDQEFISALKKEKFISFVPIDPTSARDRFYYYYVFPAGAFGCDENKGKFYVLGISDMEASARPHPASPGWKCPTRDWQEDFDWVAGKFEN